MANSVGSPFASSSTAQRLPGRRLGPDAKLTIRLDDTTNTDRILIRNHATEVVDSAHADMFLNAGESISIEADALVNIQDITIIAASGTGLVYWGIT